MKGISRYLFGMMSPGSVLTFCLMTLTFLPSLPGQGQASEVSKKLHDYLMRRIQYHRSVRPVRNESTKIMVKIGLKLTQLIDVDEKNQLMTTNVWVIQEWQDELLRWDPDLFEGVSMIHVPINHIWHPDIVLYNNADGGYQLNMDTKAVLSNTGYVKWRPPAALKSSCSMNVRYFPFDEQSCDMKFGSWTYSINEVDIVHIWQDESQASHEVYLEKGVNLKEFYRSVEWDIMGVPATKALFHYAGSEELFPQWTFTIRLKRKSLFYMVNIVIPLVAHAFLTILGFYLPSDSKQKISLCINIMLSLTVYFLMLSEITPTTSLVVPLLAEYLLFTMILVTLSVIIAGITLNVHFRSSATHFMPDWVRKVFLYLLPRMLMMRRPKIENSHDIHLKHIKLDICTCFSPSTSSQAESSEDHLSSRYQFGSKRTKTQTELIDLSRELDHSCSRRRGLSTDMRKAVDGAIYIANHLKKEDEFNRTLEDWKYVALVIDRLFLWIYTALCIIGTLCIVLGAPLHFDRRSPIIKWNNTKGVTDLLPTVPSTHAPGVVCPTQ